MYQKQTYWIRHRRGKFCVVKLVEGKQKQIADFPNKTLALEYVDKHKIAHHEGLVVDKEYSFHELFLKFANIKKEGGRNYASVLTKAAGDIYLRHFNLHIQPNFPDVPVHKIGGRLMGNFIDKLLDNGRKPEMYKTAKLVTANMRRFFRWCVSQQYHNNFQSALEYRIPKEYEPLDPDLKDTVKPNVITPAEASKLLQFVWDHRNDSVYAAYACMIFTINFYFGFRPSEMLGLKKSAVDLDKCYVDVQGMFDFSDQYIFRHTTKNAGSKRKVYFAPNGEAHNKLRWIVNYSWKYNPTNDYLIPATRGKNPLSPFMLRKIVWATYEILGMAKIKWSNDNGSKTFTILEGKFKGCINKTWRHLKAVQLIQSKNILQLSEDHIKRVMGHDDFDTTEKIYGNHDLFNEEEHQGMAAKIEQYRETPIKLLK